MAKRQIKIGLDTDMLNDAINQIRAYKRELSVKSRELTEKLAKVGIDVINITISGIPDDKRGDAVGKLLEVVEESKESVTAIYELHGGKAAFIEFSAGVTYGMAPGSYPLPSGSGMGYGTYPGQTHALDPDGWKYRGADGKMHHTYGNRAYMPVYHSTEAIAIEVGRVVSEVFS